MNRLISILITLFVIFLIYIWINSVMDKRDDQHKSFATTNVGADQEPKAESNLKLSNYDDHKNDSHEVAQRDKKAGEVVKVGGKDGAPNSESTASGQTSKGSSEKTTTTKPKDKKKSSNIDPQASPRKGSQVVANPAQKHMVIAGNFVERANAESRVKDLQREGYKNIEIVNFDLSQYHTVCAGRYDDIMEARRIAKKLQDYLNIPAYVRVGKS